MTNDYLMTTSHSSPALLNERSFSSLSPAFLSRDLYRWKKAPSHEQGTFHTFTKAYHQTSNISHLSRQRNFWSLRCSVSVQRWHFMSIGIHTIMIKPSLYCLIFIRKIPKPGNSSYIETGPRRPFSWLAMDAVDLDLWPPDLGSDSI